MPEGMRRLSSRTMNSPLRVAHEVDAVDVNVDVTPWSDADGLRVEVLAGVDDLGWDDGLLSTVEVQQEVVERPLPLLDSGCDLLPLGCRYQAREQVNRGGAKRQRVKQERERFQLASSRCVRYAVRHRIVPGCIHPLEDRSVKVTRRAIWKQTFVNHGRVVLRV